MQQAQGCRDSSGARRQFRPRGFQFGSQAASFIRARIAKGTVVHAGEAATWDNSHERFEVKRSNHQEAYRLDGACTDMAEEYFGRVRRAGIGIHHRIARSYFLRYAEESSWREDSRRVSDRDQVNRIDAPALNTSGRRIARTAPSWRALETRESVRRIAIRSVSREDGGLRLRLQSALR